MTQDTVNHFGFDAFESADLAGVPQSIAEQHCEHPFRLVVGLAVSGKTRIR